MTQEELAEAIGVSRVWYGMLESSASIRASTKLLDRLSRTLMVTPEERAELFQSALPELRVENSAAAALTPANDNKTGTILDGLPPLLASATSACSVQIDAAAYSLARARQQYQLVGTAGGVPTRSRILASWNRCRAVGVDPDRKGAPYCGDLARRRLANRRLLEAAGPIVSYLADQLAGTGHDKLVRSHLLPIMMQAAHDIEEAVALGNAAGR